MNVEMEKEFLSPGVKNGEKANLCTKMLRVFGNGTQCLGYTPKKHPVQKAFVLKSQRAELIRKRKHHVEVRYFDEFLLPLDEPLRPGGGLALGAVAVPTGVIRDLYEAATVTFFLVSAQRSCSANT
jgi:hypothetical protein